MRFHVLYKLMALQDDKDLVTKAKHNPLYFGELYDKYFDLILNYTFRRIGDFDLANDITSEVFLKAYSHLWRFKWKNLPFSAWLYRITTNEVNQYFRRKSYKAELSEDLNLHGIMKADHKNYEDEKKEAERLLKENEDFEKAQKILQTLPIAWQEVIALRYFEKKSIKEVSEILNKKEGTVKSILSRGMEKIRNAW